MRDWIEEWNKFIHVLGLIAFINYTLALLKQVYSFIIEVNEEKMINFYLKF